MKTKITSLLLVAGSLLTMNAQVVFQENFTAPFNPATAGWDASQNLSAPAGTLSPNWFQGNTTQMTALSGAPADYFAVDFRSTSSTGTNNTISAWLITPTLNLVNGGTFQFATRSGTNPAVFPERMQLYYSTAGSGTNVGTTAPGSATNTAGTFTNILLDINPNLTTTGYPSASWGIFTATVTGLAAPTVGRFAFRYYVTNGGNSGANGNYVGIDNVQYSLPCNQPTITITPSSPGVCSGNTISLLASSTGSDAATTYTWSNNAQTAAITLTPNATTTLIVSGTSTSGCVGTQTAVVTVTASPNVQTQSFTVCTNPATTVTLTATGATSYSWNTGANTSTISVTPGATTVYTVTGFAAGGVCPVNRTATVTLGSQLSVNITAATSQTICSGRTVTLTASSAATTYSWSTGATASTTTVSPSATTTYSVGGFAGSLPNVCAGGNTITITVIPSPTLSTVFTPSNVCSGADFTVTSSGAAAYIYVLSPTQTFTNNPLSATAPTVSAPATIGFTLGGIGSNGCITANIVTVTVNPNPTVSASASSPTVCENSTVTLTGSGAGTFAWAGASTSTNSSFSYSSATAGSKSFTVTGMTAGCSGTAAVSVNVVTCNINPVGLSGMGLSSSVSFFPNPFANELKVSDHSGKIEVYNAIGQLVIETVITNSGTINTTELPKGAYILKAYDNSGELVKTSKLLKN